MAKHSMGMATAVQGKGIFVGRVVATERICDDHHRISLGVEGFPAAAPGQFVQVRCGDTAGSAGAFLRRPFSIAGAREVSGGLEIDLLFRVLGVGTRWMAGRSLGDAVDVIGPLGRGFVPADGRHRHIVVGGGVGLPPVMWLARVLSEQGLPVAAVAGARSLGSLPLSGLRLAPDGEGWSSANEFGRAPVLVTTDDGSGGLRGTVLDGLAIAVGSAKAPPEPIAVYACGPEPMLRAVAGFAAERGVACQVCMERMMACGMGTCQSCVVRVRDDSSRAGWRYRLCCTDGPVFDARDVGW